MSLPPLVEPGAELSPEEVRRYSRHLLVPEIARAGQRRLKNARALVVGAGGLGAPVLQYLAAAGVGRIGVIDDDLVEESNLQRQVVHATSAVGRPKVDSAAEAMARINPLVTVRRHQVRLGGDTAALIRDYDLVLDGTDNFPTRYVVADACAEAGVPLVWGSILRFDGQVSVFWSGHGPTYRDLFPQPPAPGSVPSCGEAGVLGAVCGMVGTVMAAEAIKLITGSGAPLVGRLLVLDALAMTWREVPLHPDPNREARAPAPTEAAVSVADDAAALPTLSARQVADLLEARSNGGPSMLLVDVRALGEREIVRIPGSVHLTMEEFESGLAAEDLPRDRLVVLHCKGGGRSAHALQTLLAAGFDDVAHLDGGILAWIRDVDPSLPTY